MASNAKHEPMPQKGERVVLDAVIADLKERAEFGIKKYGTPLMTHNGRRALVDALQEAYDLVMYLKQAILEEDEGVSVKRVFMKSTGEWKVNFVGGSEETAYYTTDEQDAIDTAAAMLKERQKDETT